jgi:hypothetical protein
MSGDFSAQSRAAFAKFFPRLFSRLEQDEAVQSSAVIVDGTAVDIRVEERSIYGGDARLFAKRQVDDYMAKPLRLYMNELSASGLLSPICINFVNRLNKHLDVATHGLPRYPVAGPTFLVVFGLGLGHHLADLVERTEARWLVIAEPFIEFFQHSFGVVDWARLVEKFEARGGALYIATEIDPGRLVHEIASFMTAHGIPYSDGSWVFTHYPLWAFTEARKRLFEALEFAFINRGFFEDELRMMGNAVKNFATHDFWLHEARPRLRRAETAVIVGAGPSLDEAWETLHRIRDQVVLFSCGTALRPLLRHGLVPEYHCELENVPEVYDVIREAGKHGDLSRITLIASATVDPRVPDLFADSILYFRDSVSSTTIMAGEHRVIQATGPTCVNMAVPMANFMGFTDFALFGTDCGSRPGVGRHAEDTVYRDVGTYRKRDADKEYAMEVEGNFGGIVRTDWVYDACRLMLAGTIEHYRLNVINCSDGALIPGAQPRVPDALEISGPAVDRAAFRSAFERGTKRYAAGEILRDIDLPAVLDKVEELFVDLGRLLDELAAAPPDFAEAFRRTMKFVDGAGDRYACTEAIMAGTLQALPRIALFYGNRVSEGPVRQGVYDLFIAEFRAVLERMAKGTRELFNQLEKHVAPTQALTAAGAD